jgi:hypothetical protein
VDQKRFWILLISLHLLFMGKQLFWGNSILQDSKEYLYAADNLLNNQTLYSWNLNHAYNPDWLSKRPILYPLILAIFKTLSFGYNFIFLFLVYLSQNAASLFSFYICVKIFNFFEININWRHASVFTVFSLSQYIYCNTIMSETYLQLCLSAIVFIQICKPPNVKWSIISTFLIMSGLALKPVLMPFAYAYPIICLLRLLPKFDIKYFLPSLLPVVFIFTTITWNQSRTGYRQYSSISTINLLHYNTYTMLMFKYGEEKADSMVDDIHFKGNLLGSYASKQMYISNSCKSLISKNLDTYIFLHLRGMVFCVLDPGRFDLSQFFGLSHGKNLLYETNKDHALIRVFNSILNPLGIILVVLFIFNVFKIILVVKFLILTKISLFIKLSLLCFPFYIIFLTGPIGASRFLVPVIPFLFTMVLCLENWNLLKKKSDDLETI